MGARRAKVGEVYQFTSLEWGPYLHDNLKSLTSKYPTDKCVEPNDVFTILDVVTSPVYCCRILLHRNMGTYYVFLRKEKCERLAK